jgi:cytochrome c oxidase cbb3-type subunit 3
MPGYRTAAVVFATALTSSAGLSMAQNASRPATNLPGQAAGQSTAAAGPSATSPEWIRVPESNLIAGAVPLRPKIENPMANDPGSVHRGMQYFVEFNCVGCHAPNAGGGMGPALSEGIFLFGTDPANVYLVIAHGAPRGMPAWGGLLSDQLIWDLVSYVKSISNAPSEQWGTTISAQSASIQQVPAEFRQTATPWQFTEPFSKGQQPPEHP